MNIPRKLLIIFWVLTGLTSCDQPENAGDAFYYFTFEGEDTPTGRYLRGYLEDYFQQHDYVMIRASLLGEWPAYKELEVGGDFAKDSLTDTDQNVHRLRPWRTNILPESPNWQVHKLTINILKANDSVVVVQPINEQLANGEWRLVSQTGTIERIQWEYESTQVMFLDIGKTLIQGTFK